MTRYFKFLIPVLAIIILIAGYFIFFKRPAATPPQAPAKKQIINALPIPDRPFVAIFPHASNKLITLLLDKPGSIPQLTIDLEYLSGNALKGCRTTISFPTDLPH